VMKLVDAVLDALALAGSMTWEITWALILGFVLSAVVQALVRRESVTALLGDDRPRTLAIASGLGAASSSCSYAAIAIAKSLFQKGASAATSLTFQFASTNLVWELGLVLWVLIGWQFTLAEYLGGIVMIVLMWTLLRVFVSRELETEAREHAVRAQAGHIHNAVGSELPWRQRLTSLQAWTDVARLGARGIDAVNFGPGFTAQAHQKDERASVAATLSAFEVFRRFLAPF